MGYSSWDHKELDMTERTRIYLDTSVCVSVCAQSCPALCDPIDCSPSGSFVHGVFQERILEWVAISSSRGSSRAKD